MPQTSARLLALLSLMQSRPDWSGTELAARLGVSTRTIRNDIERLRSLDYPVIAVRGSSGHYRLGAGATLPPLLLDDDEAIAVAIGLRAASGIAGVEESSARTIAKLNHVLPSRLRNRVNAIQAAVTSGPVDTATNVPDPVVHPAVLGDLATAIREREWVRFEYRESAEVVEPYRLISWARRWYLVARDARSGDWATFRLDWMTLKDRTHRRFESQPMQKRAYTEFLLRDVASTGWKVRARITVHAPADVVLSRINPTVGVVEAIDDTKCVLVTGADSFEIMAVYVGMLGLDFTVETPSDLADHIRVLGERYRRATAS